MIGARGSLRKWKPSIPSVFNLPCRDVRNACTRPVWPRDRERPALGFQWLGVELRAGLDPLT